MNAVGKKAREEGEGEGGVVQKYVSFCWGDNVSNSLEQMLEKTYSCMPKSLPSINLYFVVDSPRERQQETL